MTYTWKLGAHISADANAAGAVCEKLAEENRLTARDLLDESRPEDAPLHKSFEWDDDVAAEKYREQQARHIINCLIVTHEDAEPTRAFFNIKVEEPNYEHIDTIMVSADKREDLFNIALRELIAFKRKYKSLSQLASVIKAIDELDEAI